LALYALLPRVRGNQILFEQCTGRYSLEEINRVSILRWPVEQCFKEGKSEVGIDYYEHRSWPAWHRHMTFVFIAQLFLLRLRSTLAKSASINTATGLPAIESRLPIKPFDKELAIRIIKYHQVRNCIAYKSHKKTKEAELQNLAP